jgi:hypothetical protein
MILGTDRELPLFAALVLPVLALAPVGFESRQNRGASALRLDSNQETEG